MVLITFSLRGNRLNLLQMKMARLVGLVIEVGQVNGSRRGRISKLEDSRHLEANTAHSVRREYWPCLLGMSIEERRMECFTPFLLPPPPPSIPSGKHQPTLPHRHQHWGCHSGMAERGCSGTTALHKRGVQLKEALQRAMAEPLECNNKTNGRPEGLLIQHSGARYGPQRPLIQALVRHANWARVCKGDHNAVRLPSRKRRRTECLPKGWGAGQVHHDQVWR